MADVDAGYDEGYEAGYAKGLADGAVRRQAEIVQRLTEEADDKETFEHFTWRGYCITLRNSLEKGL